MISAGTGWSATTPLWYTLQADNQYLHVGIAKEGEYLPIIAEKNGCDGWWLVNLFPKRTSKPVNLPKRNNT